MMSDAGQIKTLIVDDEPLARRTIRELLEVDPEIEVVGECGSGSEAVNFIRRQSPDLLFLDIQMPGMNGFEVLAEIKHARISAIVFVTAFDQYALKAFEVHALDYLLKPFTDARFEEALRQAKSQVQLAEMNRLSRKLVALLKDYDEPEETGPAREGYLTRFMIKSGGRILFLKADDIDWIAADDYYVKLHVGDRSHLLRETMNELEGKLDPQRFLRIHRSAIVNLDRVREMQQHFNGEYIVVLHNGKQLKLSRSRRERLKAMLRGGHN